MKKKLAIDQDGVLADLHLKWMDHYNRDYNDCLSKESIVGRRMIDAVKSECGQKIYDYLAIPDFFLDLEVVEDSQEVVYELSKHYEIYIATAAMEVPMSFKAKYDWLQRHFSFIPDSHYVFCGDKSIIGADILIDDSPRNLHAFKGRGILFSAFHNSGNEQFERADSWREIAELLID